MHGQPGLIGTVDGWDPAGCRGYSFPVDSPNTHYRESDRIVRSAGVHGFAGTVTRVYDMLGIDVTRVIKLPAWTTENVDRRDHVAEMVGTQTAVASRYGVYSANRVLREPRSEKRDKTIGTPVVDDRNPTGDVVGSLALVGDHVDDLRVHLEDLDRYRDLQEDGEHFAPFRLPLEIIDGVPSKDLLNVMSFFQIGYEQLSV